MAGNRSAKVNEKSKVPQRQRNDLMQRSTANVEKGSFHASKWRSIFWKSVFLSMRVNGVYLKNSLVSMDHTASIGIGT